MIHDEPTEEEIARARGIVAWAERAKVEGELEKIWEEHLQRGSEFLSDGHSIADMSKKALLGLIARERSYRGRA